MEPPKNKLEIRKNRVVCVPFNSDEYRTVVESASAFRAYMDEKIRLFPELFPENINPGYKLKDVYHSIKLCIPIRRILVCGIGYTVRPSFAMALHDRHGL